ncbi:MAG: hypothetical protein JXJ20_13825 [Anaerolineae bacterium]|nr:hypothetical protein [Anaerolineae bacterium]
MTTIWYISQSVDRDEYWLTTGPRENGPQTASLFVRQARNTSRERTAERSFVQ